MNPNKTLTDYIAACNAYDAEVHGYQLDDAAMVENCAFVFMEPRRIFRVWLQALRHRYF